MLPRTPGEALAFLQGLPPSTIKLGLERVAEALASLGNPERRYPAIHVAGTNGKGSVCAFSDACLRAAGHRVGLYTSPHLVRMNERIRVDGREIDDETFGRRVLEVLERYPRASESPFPLTYFELGTVVAFWHFAQEQVDVAVIETGLGGRLDATTCCAPWVTAVTSISFDHMELLGDTLPAIAGEKAGIFKAGVPALSVEQPPGVLEVFQRVTDERVTSLRLEGRDFSLERDAEGRLQYRGLARSCADVTVSLQGEHQRHNAALAIACLELLHARGLEVPEAAIREGLAHARWPGRLEEIPGSPLLVLDGAHNPGGVDALTRALNDRYRGRRVHAVFGVLADKSWRAMMDVLFPRCASVTLVQLQNPRALPLDQAAGAAKTLNGDVTVVASIEEALASAKRRAQGDDLVLCAGSLVLIGAVKALLERSPAHN